MNFWKNLTQPFFVLAPMDDVTDVVFRQVVATTAKPEVFFTEFTNVDGLQSAGRAKLLPRLMIHKPTDHPIVAQIWGVNPENYFKTAKEIKAMGFDGIDINMGCPVGKIVKNGTCSALIDYPEKAKQIIEATIKGAGGLPVSVKTRIGTKTVKTEEWIGFLLQFPLAAITIHGRTAKEMSKVPAHWDEIGKAVRLRDQFQESRANKSQQSQFPETLIIGNGDVLSYQQGLDYAQKYGVDGVMIGRGIFHDPWIFKKQADSRQDTVKTLEPSAEERLELLLYHARLFMQTWGRSKRFITLRRFFKIYAQGFEGAAQLRAKLMETENLEQVEELVAGFIA